MHHALPGAQTAQDGTNIPLMKAKPTYPAVLSRGEWVTWTTKQPETGEYPKGHSAVLLLFASWARGLECLQLTL